MKLLITICTFTLFPLLIYGSLPIGEIPAEITLQGDDGGKMDGTAWSSSEIRGKMYILFYADPDEKELNDDLPDLLLEENFPLDRYGSIAIINMDATWLPPSLISVYIKDKQKEYPQTTYIRDMKKTIVKKWNLGDDNSDVVLFDKEGRVLFSVDGELSTERIENLIKLIKENLY
jgi:YtfJ family uncharacterized protein